MLIGVNMLSTGGGGGFAAPGATKNGLSSGSTCGSAAKTGRASLVGRNGPVDTDEDEDTSLALRFPRLLPEEEESGGPAGSAASCVAGGGWEHRLRLCGGLLRRRRVRKDGIADVVLAELGVARVLRAKGGSVSRRRALLGVLTCEQSIRDSLDTL